MSTSDNWSFSSWWSGILPATKKRKTMDGATDVDEFEERLNRLEERERKAEARDQRVESMLKKVLENQKQILSKYDDSAADDDEGESEEEAEEIISTPRKRSAKSTPSKSSARKWTDREERLVIMGVALYGKDYKEIGNILEDRNHNQINGFFRRKWGSLVKESKQYPVQTEEDRIALMEAIERCKKDDAFEEEHDEEDGGDDDEEEEEVEEKDGDKTRKNWRQSPSNGRRAWTDKEERIVAMGIALYGRNSMEIGALLKNRNRNQLNGFFARKWDSLLEESKQYRNSTQKDKTALMDLIKQCQEEDEDEQVDGDIFV